MKKTIVSVFFLGLVITTCFFSSGGNTLHEPDAVEGLQSITHLATREDIEKLKQSYGVYDPARECTSVSYDLGTGDVPPTEEEWDAMIGSLHILDHVVSDRGLRSSVDLSSSPYFPQVRSQGAQGSCSAWATAYYANGFLQAKHNGWDDASLGNNHHLLSPAFTYNKCCIHKPGKDGGSSTFSNYKIMEAIGVCTWNAMPYSQFEYIDWGDETAWRESPLYRTTPSISIHRTNIENIKELLNNEIPVTFSINGSILQNGGFGVDDVLGSTVLQNLVTNHAQCLVGYDDSKIDSETGEIGAFKVVNSWGTWWQGCPPGCNGFYWVSYTAFLDMRCAIANVRYCADLYVNSHPTLLGIWTLDPQEERHAEIIMGIGSHHYPLETRTPSLDIFHQDIYPFPMFMCLDITEFNDKWRLGEDGFFLYIGASIYDGEIDVFKIEYYRDTYTIGNPDRVSVNSPDCPCSTPGYVDVTFSFTPAGVLLIHNNQDHYETYYTDALDSTPYSYDVWDIDEFGAPTATIVSDYRAVIWYTGDSNAPITNNNRDMIIDYLDTHWGRLFITGFGIPEQWRGTDFYRTYLHAEFLGWQVQSRTLTGSGGPIGGSLSFGIDNGGDGTGANNQPYWLSHEHASDQYGSSVFQWSLFSYGAIKADTGEHRVVYFDFGFEAIDNQQDRNTVMRRVLDWITPEFQSPVVTITSGPPPEMPNVQPVHFGWMGRDHHDPPVNLLYKYQLLTNGVGSWSPTWEYMTSIDYPALQNNSYYEFQVQIKDTGNHISYSSVWSFTIGDATPPEVIIDSGPEGLIHYNNVGFSWHATEGFCEYSYRLVKPGPDDPWSDWTQTPYAIYRDLPDGQYRFEVQARDPAGNMGSVASQSFQIVYQQPRTPKPPEGSQQALDPHGPGGE